LGIMRLTSHNPRYMEEVSYALHNARRHCFGRRHVAPDEYLPNVSR